MSTEHGGSAAREHYLSMRLRLLRPRVRGNLILGRMLRTHKV